MRQQQPKAIRLDPNDNVLVALCEFQQGQRVESEEIETRVSVPPGHKIAVALIRAGEAIRKYNQIIGFATTDIAPGDHVHTHNCAFGEFDRDYAYCSETKHTDFVSQEERATFMGYKRAAGRIGTRNYLGVLTSVNCSATVAKRIAETVNHSGVLNDYPNVDGIVALVHGTGCSMDADGEGFAILQRTLWGYARHANFFGILLVGLGCEVNQIPLLLNRYGFKEGHNFRSLVMQEEGGTKKTVDAGMRYIQAMLPAANACQRERVDASGLTVALQCGGSDGYSGITANPAMGAAVDRLVRHGGTAILSETPEIYGAEHLLTRRAKNRAVGEKLIERIRWWEDYTRRHHGVMDNNPAPGNKAGGLTTILEKSLGAASKGGTTNLNGVYAYAEPVDTTGFVFMDSPGFDPCSVTGQVASGANLVCFSTGRGSAFGFKPAPSIKLATNTAMYDRLRDDMDINCGAIANGEKTVDEVGGEIFDYILAVASGKKSKSEEYDYGDNEFVPWHIGTVM